ncbi:MAG: DUF4251 domain-containing protein [Ginsengibacter sp.]
MKIKYFLIIAFIIIVSAFGCSNTRNAKAGQVKDSISVRNMVESQGFVFIPRYVNAVGVRNRDLSFGYEISVSKDTIKSYLPFFGRGYIAPISPTDVDFDFTSTKFTNTTKPASRGWSVSIKPKDQRYLQELYFRIFDNASASLTVTSNDRSSISYSGYITERKLKKEKK